MSSQRHLPPWCASYAFSKWIGNRVSLSTGYQLNMIEAVKSLLGLCTARQDIQEALPDVTKSWLTAIL